MLQWQGDDEITVDRNLDYLALQVVQETSRRWSIRLQHDRSPNSSKHNLSPNKGIPYINIYKSINCIKVSNLFSLIVVLLLHYSPDDYETINENKLLFQLCLRVTLRCSITLCITLPNMAFYKAIPTRCL